MVKFVHPPGITDTAGLAKWFTIATAVGNGSLVIHPTAGPGGGPGLRVTGGSLNTSGGYVEETIDAGDDTAIIGTWCRINSVLESGTAILQVLLGGVRQLSVRINADRTISVLRGSNQGGTVIGTSPSSAVVPAGAEVHVGLKAVVRTGTSGSFTIYLNGFAVKTVSGINTAGAGVNGYNGGRAGMIALDAFGPGSAAVWDFANLFLIDGTTSVADPVNDFPGDCPMEVQWPTSDAEQDFTPSTGTDHYALVDEHPPTDDADYVEDSTVGNADTWGFPAIAASGGTILADIGVAYARKTDAGARSIAGRVTVGGTDYDSAVDQALASSYRYYQFIRATNPATGAAWLEAALNAATSGVKVSA